LAKSQNHWDEKTPTYNKREDNVGPQGETYVVDSGQEGRRWKYEWQTRNRPTELSEIIGFLPSCPIKRGKAHNGLVFQTSTSSIIVKSVLRVGTTLLVEIYIADI
jgi:hypothetical protein